MAVIQFDCEIVMRVSREQAAENREHIIDTAARLFREKGFDGIGVADLMSGAGFTHGGFYGHFASKEELMAEAASRALDNSLGDWDRMIASAPNAPPLDAVVHSYLSQRHRDRPGQGCALAALGPDLARQSPSVRQSASRGVAAFIEKLSGIVSGKSRAQKRSRAIAAYAAMVGGMVLARAVDDPALSEEILTAAAAGIHGVGGPAK